MPLSKSLIARLFAFLFALTLFTLLFAGLGIYLYTRQVVGEEFIRLNQATLRQQASSMAVELTYLRDFGERISMNTKLNQLVASSGSTSQMQAASLLKELSDEYILSHRRSNVLFSVHLLGSDGTRVSTYNAPYPGSDNIIEEPAFTPLWEGKADMVMLPTAFNQEGRGVMMYSYQMVFAMEPAFSLAEKQVEGLVVIDISEITLFSGYSNFIQNGIDVAVVDQEGQTISHKDKLRIGHLYTPSPANISEKASLKSVDQRIISGAFHLLERIPGTDWFLLEQIPARIAFEPLARMLRVDLVIILAVATLMLIAFAFAYVRIRRPIKRIQAKMEQVIAGDLSVRIAVVRDDEFGRIEESFNSMVEEISRLIDAVKRQEKEKRLAELDFLQAQINPHFIYNTLTSIRFMLEMDKVKEAGEMIFYFSKLLRETLSRSDEFVSLRDELQSLDNYLALQALRYRDSFEVSKDLDPEVLEAGIPTLLLQPIVENSIFHAAGLGKISIKLIARREGEDLIIIIMDDGIGMSSEQRRTIMQKDLPINRVGLRNVQERIQLSYGMDYGLSLSETEGGGTTVTFLLPFLTYNQEEEGGESL